MPAIPDIELDLMRSVFRRHGGIRDVKLFGSRAKGTHTIRSDIDLAVSGDLGPLEAAQIAAELDELPLPYRYDVISFSSIKLSPLREHIERVGITIYPAAVCEHNS